MLINPGSGGSWQCDSFRSSLPAGKVNSFHILVVLARHFKLLPPYKPNRSSIREKIALIWPSPITVWKRVLESACSIQETNLLKSNRQNTYDLVSLASKMDQYLRDILSENIFLQNYEIMQKGANTVKIYFCNQIFLTVLMVLFIQFILSFIFYLLFTCKLHVVVVQLCLVYVTF